MNTQLSFTPHQIALTVGSMNWFWRWAVRRILKAGFTVWMQDNPGGLFRVVVQKQTVASITAKKGEYSVASRAEELGLFKVEGLEN